MLVVMIISLISGFLSSQAQEKLRFRRDLSLSSRRKWMFVIYGLPFLGPILYMRRHKQWLALREAAYTLD